MPVNRLLIIKSDMAQTRKHIPTPTKEVTFKITGSGKTAAGIKTVLITLPVMVNLRLTVMMEKVQSKQGKEKTLTGVYFNFI
ncbi:hypothetical protein ABKS44_26490 [Escherichia coli]